MSEKLQQQIQQLQSILDSSKQIIFFTGAGVSVDSGIPDFRSVDGLYNTKYDYPPEEILSHHFFLEEPEEFYRFYRDKIIHLEAEPNDTHRFIAEAEEKKKSLGVITQNIDGLHQKAGSEKVYELHGSILRNYCTKCNTFYDVEYIESHSPLPLCEKCGSLIKPDVVLYEEGLDTKVINDSVDAIMKADTMIVLGTSLVVYPAAGFLQYFRGQNLVILNRDATPMDNAVELCIHASFKDVIPHLHL